MGTMMPLFQNREAEYQQQGIGAVAQNAQNISRVNKSFHDKTLSLKRFFYPVLGILLIL
jgi:hypothetical protein